MDEREDLPRLLWRPAEAWQILGIGPTTGYALLRSGALSAAKIGGCTRIHDTELRRFAAERAGLTLDGEAG